MYRLVLLGALAGCFIKPSPQSSSDASTDVVVDAVPQPYHKTITIVQPPSAALVNFPLSVVLSAAPDLQAHASGGDIGFSDAGGVPLPCEIVTYRQGSLEAWVLVPSVAAAPTTTSIEIGYGGPPAMPCHDTDPWPEYLGVWHLSSTDLLVEHDSSAHVHELTASSSAEAPVMEPTGMVGAARSFNPPGADLTDDQLCDSIPPPDQSLEIGNTESISFLIWVKATANLGTFDTTLYKGGGSLGNPGFELDLGSLDWSAAISDSINQTDFQVAADTEATLDTWHELVAVVDRATSHVRTYFDGQPRTNAPMTFDALTGSAPFCLGHTGYPYQGLLDEPRVYAGAMSTARVGAEYANIADHALFMSIGPEH